VRKDVNYVVPSPAQGEPENRDAGKVFRIREMPAMQAEKWAMRALMAIARSGADIGAAVGGGMQELAGAGLQALMSLRFEDAEPLLDEMMECVSIRPDPRNPQIDRPLTPDDIEEVSTMLALRSEVLHLHTGFSVAGAGSRSTSPIRSSASSSSPTPTSLAQ